MLSVPVPDAASSSALKRTPVVPAARPTAVCRSPAVNAIWNWAGTGTEAVTAFLLTPVLIRSLGDETYGLWILIGSLTGCFGVLDLGMRGAVGRYIALHHSKGDRESVQNVVSTAAVWLCLVAVVAVAGVFATAAALPLIYDISADQIGTVRAAICIVGVQLGLFFFSKLYDAALWAYQRFDLLNMVDIPTTLIRFGLVAWLVSHGSGLIALACVSLVTVLFSGAAKGWLAIRNTPGGLSIRPRHATRSMMRQLTGYGMWDMINRVAQMARSQMSPAYIATFIGLGAVAPFAVVMRLPTLARSVLFAATGTLMPIAVAIHAQADHKRRERFLIEGTRLSLSFSLYAMAMFFWLGDSLLSLWIRPEFAQHWNLLAIVAAGETLPLAMSVAAGMFQAMARHRPLAGIAVIETAGVLLLGGALGYRFGLVGFATGMAIAAFLCRGLYYIWFACNLTSMPIRRYLKNAFLVPILCASALCVPLHLIVRSHPPACWTGLFWYSILFSAAYFLTIPKGVLDTNRIRPTLSGDALRAAN